MTRTVFTARRSMAAVLALATGALAVPAVAQEVLTARLDFFGRDGVPAGTGTASALPVGVLFEIEVRGLTGNSWVAVHVHETGSCDPAGGHESAGGHFNPADTPHGYRSAGGPHAGDLPNQYVPADGILRAQIFAPLLTLGSGAADVRGRALIVHAGPDDYQSQPSGGAGDRLACAPIT